MTRAVVVINTKADRDRIAAWARNVKPGTVVTFKESKRSVPQNSLLWAMLTEVAQKVPWHGVKLSPDDWKIIFLNSLKQELRMVPNLDGNGFVQLGRSSSELTKDEMSALLELIAAFGTHHGVKFNDEIQLERNAA